MLRTIYFLITAEKTKLFGHRWVAADARPGGKSYENEKIRHLWRRIVIFAELAIELLTLNKA